uniref:Probable sulfate transporter 3.4 n=1 Tax=Tanacetum cinerariifolium TaxID=118510 RepID=A0A699I823_TANCI|nr:probable sulfate transporter 3.4 [Tanacetum cinerariifolium]GEZ39622.1 probable sulfate transporter 3.4 [Tanacetum cinerariifolium]
MCIDHNNGGAVMDMGLRILLLARVLAVRGKKIISKKSTKTLRLQRVTATNLLVLQDGFVEQFSSGQDPSFVPPVICSVLGSSRDSAVGPVSIASLVMGTMLNKAVPYAQDPVLYLKLAFAATFL